MEIGKIVNTFGIKGELKVLTYNDYFNKNKDVYINNKKMEIEKVRFQKNIAIVKFKGLDDMTEAENLKGATIEIDETSAPKLPKDTYYIKDLIGLDVYTDDGKLLGKLDDVFNTGANDIYQIGKILLPATKEVIKKIDIENKKITVHILEGLL
jgi:16S rRNA processing protein RimM